MLSVIEKILIFVKKLKINLSSIVMSRMFSIEKKKDNYLLLSRYEDQELSFVDDKPWILFLGEKKTKFNFRLNPDKRNRVINKNKQSLKKIK